MYEVLLERAAQKDLKSLPAETYHKILVLIKSLRDNPRPPGSKKLSHPKELWRVRSGSYRIVYIVDDSNKEVPVRVRHRREVYR